MSVATPAYGDSSSSNQVRLVVTDTGLLFMHVKGIHLDPLELKRDDVSNAFSPEPGIIYVANFDCALAALDHLLWGMGSGWFLRVEDASRIEDQEGLARLATAVEMSYQAIMFTEPDTGALTVGLVQGGIVNTPRDLYRVENIDMNEVVILDEAKLMDIRLRDLTKDMPYVKGWEESSE